VDTITVCPSISSIDHCGNKDCSAVTVDTILFRCQRYKQLRMPLCPESLAYTTVDTMIPLCPSISCIHHFGHYDTIMSHYTVSSIDHCKHVIVLLSLWIPYCSSNCFAVKGINHCGHHECSAIRDMTLCGHHA